jgi:hypothetical protein
MNESKQEDLIRTMLVALIDRGPEANMTLADCVKSLDKGGTTPASNK